ncbi:MAG: cell division protein FtsZ [Acidobacteria bacterium]|nr:cell division protein FtsZ [Acidobacteriota bacterium]
MNNEGVKFTFDEAGTANTRIKVFGVGGAGCNAVNRMIEAGVEGVTFTAINTDDQALRASNAEFKLQLGSRLTLGRGAGSDPEVGRAAALEDTEQLIELLGDADMVFVTAGLGGGTGTGAAPIVASLANELGALTVAVVTKPFAFEGRQRMAVAEKGLAELAEAVDTVITIPNERLIEVVERGTSFFESFRIADDILRQAVQGISDIITIPGIINRDFADVRTIMHGMGYAVMGTAVAEGPNAAIDAARKAVSSPLLEDAGIEGARGLLISITGSSILGLHDVHEASSVIQKTADPEANIIFGAVLDESMGDKIKITVIATGFRSESMGVSRKMTADAAVSNAEIRQNLQQAAASRERERSFPAPRKAAVEAESSEKLEVADPRLRYEPLEEPEEAEMDPSDLEKPAYLRRRMGID